MTDKPKDNGRTEAHFPKEPESKAFARIQTKRVIAKRQEFREILATPFDDEETVPNTAEKAPLSHERTLDTGEMSRLRPENADEVTVMANVREIVTAQKPSTPEEREAQAEAFLKMIEEKYDLSYLTRLLSRTPLREIPEQRAAREGKYREAMEGHSSAIEKGKQEIETEVKVARAAHRATGRNIGNEISRQVPEHAALLAVRVYDALSKANRMSHIHSDELHRKVQMEALAGNKMPAFSPENAGIIENITRTWALDLSAILKNADMPKNMLLPGDANIMEEVLRLGPMNQGDVAKAILQSTLDAERRRTRIDALVSDKIRTFPQRVMAEAALGAATIHMGEATLEDYAEYFKSLSQMFDAWLSFMRTRAAQNPDLSEREREHRMTRISDAPQAVRQKAIFAEQFQNLTIDARILKGQLQLRSLLSQRHLTFLVSEKLQEIYDRNPDHRGVVAEIALRLKRPVSVGLDF